MALNATERAAVRGLRDAARNAWAQARLLRATQGADLTRSDMAMQRLYEALQGVERLDLSDPPPAGTARKGRRKA